MNITYRKHERNTDLFSCHEMLLTESVTRPRARLSTYISTQAGQAKVLWDCLPSDVMVQAHDRLKKLIKSQGSVSREYGLILLSLASKEEISEEMLEAICIELKCSYATMTTQAGTVRAKVRNWGWGVEVLPDGIWFTFKHQRRIVERVKL